MKQPPLDCDLGGIMPDKATKRIMGLTASTGRRPEKIAKALGLITDGHAATRAACRANASAGADLTQVFHQFGSSSSNVQFNYTYNTAHQVSGAGESTTGTSLPTGDITPRPTAASNTGALTYNTANQSQLAACSASKPCYNAEGDLIYDGTRSFTCDTEGDGRILTATNGSTTATYLYNPFGQRVAKIVNGVVTGYTLSAAGHEVAEFTNGNVTRYNFFDPSQTAPIASTDASGNPTYYYPDNLGSIILTTQGSTITNSIGYLPYGQTTTGTLTGTPFGYAGYRYDAETGLYHTATRSYDPNTGRFLQPDPIGYQGGRNVYAYAGGDPINNTDPKGSDFTGSEDFGGGGGGSGGGDFDPFGQTVGAIYLGIEPTLGGNHDVQTAANVDQAAAANGVDPRSLTPGQVDYITGGALSSFALTSALAPEAASSLPQVFDAASNSSSGSVGPNGYVPQPGDATLLARMMFTEDAEEPDAFAGLGYTAVNRVDSGIVGETASTLGGVLYAPGQFQGMYTGSSQYDLSANPSGLTGPNLSSFNQALSTAQGILGGSITDPTDGATSFYTGSNAKGLTPQIRSGNLVQTLQVGRVHFLKIP